jgi:hypothetical protein
MTTREMARRLGSLGGRARARRLSVDERRRIAGLGGHARRRSLQAERHLLDNFHYLAMVDDLRGPPPQVTPMKTFKGPLPGLYVRSSDHPRKQSGPSAPT